MSRSDIEPILARVETLAQEIKLFVPQNPSAIQFRADLAGLLVVSIAASYESCVKETIMNYASRHHPQFGLYAQNQYDRLNSKIKIGDLYGYAKTFDVAVHNKFKSSLEKRRSQLSGRIGKDFVSAYAQILRWRHDFAHAGVRNTTIEEAIITHRLAKRVVITFNDSFI